MQAPGPGRQPWEQPDPRGREGGRAGRAGGAPSRQSGIAFLDDELSYPKCC